MNAAHLTLVLLLLVNPAFGTEIREMTATKIAEEIIIDGILDESSWDKAELADDFYNYMPNPGEPTLPSVAQILYDNEAVYVAAFMEEYSIDSIMTELTERDDIGNTDFFGVYIDTYGAGSEASEFIVASTGVQFDANIRQNYGEDSDWNAVWFSEVKLTDKGWYVEIKIPYAALRFPKSDQQKWRVNFFRSRTVDGTKSSWQPVDFKLDNAFLACMGELKGISGIKPPLRLSISPYASVYALNQTNYNEDGSSSTGYSYNAGLDLKYGINEAFTLDMVLIPDFGQVRSDDQVLNLSPFEVRFSENRQFFTEGVSLFTKAGIFYSRRVGGSPVNYWEPYDELSDSEEVSSNPQSTQLFNATKISGRTEKGLGIGIFNAVSKKTEAIIRDIETGDERTLVTQPLTNYSMIVLDQNLKNNSSVTFSNSNVLRDGSFSDANVSAAETNIKLLDQKYEISGKLRYSTITETDSENTTGNSLSLDAGKIQGNFNYGIFYDHMSDSYNHNDLGFMRNNNTREVGLYGNYNNPDKGFWKFPRFNSWFNFWKEWLYDSNEPTQMSFNIGAWGQLENFHNMNAWFNAAPETYDYFEAREDGRVYISPAYVNGGLWYGTDYRKALRVTLSSFISNTSTEERYTVGGNGGIRYRFNDKLSSNLLFSYNHSNNNEGYVTHDDNDDIIFGKRDRITFNNQFLTTYTFNSKMALDFRLRHYWAKVFYNSYHTLLADGSLGTSGYDSFNDFAYSAFNIDMVYTWRFAPGSDLSLVWKNSIFGSESDALIDFSEYNYSEGFKSLSDLPQDNSLSLRVVYYLDYATVAARFR